MFDQQEPEIKLAIEAVRQAALLVRQVRASTRAAVRDKADRSPVTVADFASQALVARRLASTFPDCRIVAEENSDELRRADSRPLLGQVVGFVRHFIPEATAEEVCEWIDLGTAEPGDRYWTLDPIDGTKGFLRGDQYVVALALIAEGSVQIGVLGCPNLDLGVDRDSISAGSLVLAVRGSGTWAASLPALTEYTRLSVSERREHTQARLLRSFESGHTNTAQLDEFVRRLSAQSEPLRLDSQAKYALLAAGQGDLLLRLLSPEKPDYREKIWDQAAGSLIVEEAGGKVTDLYGRSLDFTAGRTLRNNQGVLASNGHLHASALETLREVL